MRKGQLSLQLLIFSAVTVILISGFSTIAQSVLNISLRNLNKANAFMIAEAGIEYYRWHLAHNPTDYQDGTGNPGLYTHNYYDKDGVLVGSFILEITPPPIGSSIVSIKSTGMVIGDSSVQKIIKVKMGIPSFSKYAWILNDNVNFGSTSEVFGLIHSNTGIRFDGLAHNLVTSALTQYNDPDHSGGDEFSIHTHRIPIDPLPPATVPSRTDIFAIGRQFPVPVVDFSGITQNLSQIKEDAITNGFYAPSSTVFGYDLLLKNNGTFDLFRINTLLNIPPGCSTSTWSIQSETLLGNYPYPTNGLIFLEDNAWVRGQVSSTRITIASGRFPNNPATQSSIIINNDIRYNSYDGQDVVGLIAQNNITTGLMSNDVLRIDAAMIAQNGRISRPSYNSSCGANYLRSQIISYGMMGSNQRSAFFYGSNGYQARSYTYDTNLLYGPPPSYPTAGNQYVQLSWEEVK